MLSLPVMSYLLLPNFGTYATSLNLMFFYMTWSTLVLSHSPLHVEVIGTFAAHTLSFLLPAILFLLVDTAIPSLIVDYKSQAAAGLPTRTGGVKGARKRKATPQWYQVVGLSMLNIAISVAIQAGIELLLTEVLHVRSGLKITRTLPMPWIMARDVLRAFAIREVSVLLVNSQTYECKLIFSRRSSITTFIDSYTNPTLFQHVYTSPTPTPSPHPTASRPFTTIQFLTSSQPSSQSTFPPSSSACTSSHICSSSPLPHSNPRSHTPGTQTCP